MISPGLGQEQESEIGAEEDAEVEAEGEASGEAEDEASGEEEASGESEASADGEGEEEEVAEEEVVAEEEKVEEEVVEEEVVEEEAEVEAEAEAEEEVVEEEIVEEETAELKSSEGGEEEEEEEASGEEESDTDGEESGDDEEECVDVPAESGSGDVEGILALDGKKCSKKEKTGSEEMAEILFECDMNGMDEKLAGCMSNMDERVKTLEQTMMSGGGGLEDQIALVLVKKGVIDCENDTQCADDRACLDSYVEPGRKMCEKPCDRHRCDVPYSECVAEDHKPKCECKEEFHGNASVACIPSGFEEQNNSRSYRMFDDEYVTFDNATQKCQDLGARLPVLDSEESIQVVMNFLETADFEVFEQWDRSSRRVWLGLNMDRSSGLIWADGQRVIGYPASARLFVWEARRILSQEVSYADNSRHYALYIDGDIAKLPGGGRRGAAVLCELAPNMIREPSAAYDPYANDPRYNSQQYERYPPGYPTENRG